MPWRLLIAIATLASFLASARLAGISGQLAAVRAGSVPSVVHRGAFLFKIQGACPSTQRDSQATANLQARPEACQFDLLLRKKWATGNQIVYPFDLASNFQVTPLI
ncbi:hypothetical protein [Cupriavidus necator]